MKIEADENVIYIAFWVCATVVLLAGAGVGWFAIDRYDKRVHTAMEHGYTIDRNTMDGSSYMPPNK